jgi:N6-adenosine-specific RNA methylase IME4
MTTTLTRSKTALKVHPAAEIFPMLNAEELDALALDIKANGLQQPIVMWEGLLLDGRNRLAACAICGVEPSFKQYEGNSPVTFVISANIKRRQLDASQRACVAVELEPMFAVEAKKRQVRKAADSVKVNLPEQKLQQSRDQAAEVVGVSPSMVSLAKAIKVSDPAMFDRVKFGDMTINAARQETRAVEVHDRLVNIAIPKGKHRVIYADPPWWYATPQHSKTEQATVLKSHYPSMKIDEICALPIKDMAADDAVLFLWTTSPLLFEAAKVIEAWGFKYKASIIWDKVKHNVGHYVSVRHEFLLICTRGSCPKDSEKLADSVVVMERTEHSAKPDVFRDMIDEMYEPVKGDRVELFARADLPKHWKAWGNQNGNR